MNFFLIFRNIFDIVNGRLLVNHLTVLVKAPVSACSYLVPLLADELGVAHRPSYRRHGDVLVASYGMGNGSTSR